MYHPLISDSFGGFMNINQTNRSSWCGRILRSYIFRVFQCRFDSPLVPSPRPLISTFHMQLLIHKCQEIKPLETSVITKGKGWWSGVGRDWWKCPLTGHAVTAVRRWVDMWVCCRVEPSALTHGPHGSTNSEEFLGWVAFEQLPKVLKFLANVYTPTGFTSQIVKSVK